MKYYIYISDAKVDMLFPQVPHEIKKKVATEWKMDIKLLGASRKVETETEDNRIARLETVVDFINQYGNVGTVDEPDHYVFDTLPMRWAPLGEDRSPVVFFGGQTKTTIVGLGGSRHHMLGVRPRSFDGTVPGGDIEYASSEAPNLLDALAKVVGADDDWKSDPESSDLDELDTVKRYVESLKGRKQSLEFLAKRLVFASADEIKAEEAKGYERFNPQLKDVTALKSYRNVLLATPLYVAMAD